MSKLKPLPPDTGECDQREPAPMQFILTGLLVGVTRFTGGFTVSIMTAGHTFDFELRGAIAPDWLKVGAEVEFDSEKARITLLS